MQNFILVSSKATSFEILLKSLYSIVTQSSEKMQQFSKVAAYGAWSTTIANSNWSQKPDNIQNFKEDEDGDVIMIIENDVEMEEIPSPVFPSPVYPAPVYNEDVEMEETRDGKLTGKKKGKKSKNKLNNSF